MKRILSLTLSLLMLMSMATIVGAATDSNVVWQEDFNDGVAVGSITELGNNYISLPLVGTDGTMVFKEDRDRNRVLANSTVTFPEGAYGKGNHEKSMFIYIPAFTGDTQQSYLATTFANELPISDNQMGHIGFDWINFATGGRDGGTRYVYLNVKFLNAEQEEVIEQVYIGQLYDRQFWHYDNSKVAGDLANWNRLSVYLKGSTVYVAGFYGDTWKSFDMITSKAERAGYTPVSVVGLEAQVRTHYTAKSDHLYGFDNFIAEKVTAVPAAGTTNQEGYFPAFVPFVDASNRDMGNYDRLTDKQQSAISKNVDMTFLNDTSGALPENTTAAVHTRTFLTYDEANWNIESDHEAIIENVEGYYITDDTDRAAVMGAGNYTMSDGLNFGQVTGLAVGDKLQYSFDFKYINPTTGSDHILMKLITEEAGVVRDLMRMKADGTLISASGDALTKLAADTYYRVDVVYTVGETTTADIYVNGKLIETTTPYGWGVGRVQKTQVTLFGEPMGEAETVTFGGVTTSAVKYYAHSLHIDNIYVNNVKAMGAYNKTPYVAYDLNKSLSEASDNIAKYGIVLDPGSMTASRVSNDFTAASFLAAVNLPNVSVVDAEGNALTGDEALVGNKIKITGEFGAPVYYTAVATGANIADTDFVLEATQNGALLGATCAAGSAVTVKAVDDNYATPQIFVAEYETVNGKLNLVSCKGGTGSASLTPSAAGNTVKVFVVSTMDGLQPLYDTNLTFTVQ